jgi:hypothetical protein
MLTLLGSLDVSSEKGSKYPEQYLSILHHFTMKYPVVRSLLVAHTGLLLVTVLATVLVTIVITVGYSCDKSHKRMGAHNRR